MTTDRDALVAEFLAHACIFAGSELDVAAKWRRAERLRVRHPELATASIHTAVVCGELEHVAALLREDPRLFATQGGPQDWEPLLFACYGRLPNARAAEHSLAIARLLLDAGADPNAYFVTRDDWRLRFTALTGVMGQGEMDVPEHPRANELARLLLDRGASPNDSQGLYNTHLRGDDTKWLELLFEYGLDEADPINWHAFEEDNAKSCADKAATILDYLLPQAAAQGHVRRLRCLLDRGADANARSIYTGRSSYQAALVAGRLDIADLLLRHGAVQEPVQGRDAFASACSLGNRAEAVQLVREHPEVLECTDPMIDAAGAGKHEVVRLLLELGMSPNVPGRHCRRALHAACEDARMVRLLLDHGADPRARCEGGTAAQWALFSGKPEVARLLATHSRDLFDAVSSGHDELVAELVAAAPACVLERNANGATPLHVLPEDLERARRILAVLLAHGADPTACNADGRTAAQQLEAVGLDTIADLLPPS
jgi:ankyrin repeat protein